MPKIRLNTNPPGKIKSYMMEPRDYLMYPTIDTVSIAFIARHICVDKQTDEVWLEFLQG
jgi:hypothetical protein